MWLYFRSSVWSSIFLHSGKCILSSLRILLFVEFNSLQYDIFIFVLTIYVYLYFLIHTMKMVYGDHLKGGDLEIQRDELSTISQRNSQDEITV